MKGISLRLIPLLSKGLAEAFTLLVKGQGPLTITSVMLRITRTTLYWLRPTSPKGRAEPVVRTISGGARSPTPPRSA